MYAITGVTGHVGGAAARELLAHGEPVRAIIRTAAKAEAWTQAGAQIAFADFADRTALTAAFRGCRAAFVMLPTDPSFPDPDAGHRHLADSIAGAVADSGVPYVVMLSSIGAELPDGTGPIRWLHHLETQLRRTGVTLTAIRAPHFQEKVETLLDTARDLGIYPVFADSADHPIPMVATRDIGRIVAAALTTPSPADDILALDPLTTPNARSPRNSPPSSANPSKSSPSRSPTGPPS
ncbi:NAD(P)H-binding protein [Nonomuraea sp. NPDC050310]|uniref:NAD(P)H-binding protein n=1 Tax=Nonomuraea sp. NPDC050310 TaxID=3154935 RepID=UPI0033E4FA83